MKNITINNARIHNLRNLDVSIPKHTLVAVTGVSGSGKSSLAFDVIFEEGRRQYLRSLGVLTGFDDEERCDHVSGLGPAIAVQQSLIRQSNPRSTVGSRTGILSMLGVLYAGEGRIHCSVCGTPVDDDLRCPGCGNEEERLPARYFSYNAPEGMCLGCSGRGVRFDLDMERLVPDGRMTLRAVFERAGVTPGYARLLNKRFGDHMDTAFSLLPAELKEEAIYGHQVDNNPAGRSYCLLRLFEGQVRKFGEDPEGIYGARVCPSCGGFRIGEEARRVFLQGTHIGKLGRMTLSETAEFYRTLPERETLSVFGRNLLREIVRKTDSLISSRLGHLSLYREMPSLSGGEIQRLFLNSHLYSEMDSLIYVLDEPTIGLHESEKCELLLSVKALRDLGNTVILVEHDRNSIAAADYVIDLGPKAGIEGGRIVYQGDYTGLLHSNESITGGYLSGRIPVPVRNLRRDISAADAVPHLTVRDAATHNLKGITVSFPLGVLVGVAGVSGSGKSSLVSDTLIPLLKRHFHDRRGNGRGNAEPDDGDGGIEPVVIEAVADRLEGTDHIGGYVEVSQAPIGRNMNSTPASYTGVWDKIRGIFADQPEAAEQGLTAGHFSFNSKGACPVCGGSGREKIWLGGPVQIYKTCSGCGGKRYSDEALSVRYRGRNILDVLEMSVGEAAGFFSDYRGIAGPLEVLQRIGMGYLELGQPTPSLSGGEAQRVKLAREIGRKRNGRILYILDEPTTGLSLHDISALILLLDELISRGNSVIVIEHDPAVLTSCDWIVELGPGGGIDGGRIIAQGSPGDLKADPGSVTGRYL